MGENGKDNEVVLNQQDLKTLRAFNEPCERARAAVRTSEMAMTTFVRHVLEQANAETPPDQEWTIDWVNSKLVRVPRRGPRGS